MHMAFLGIEKTNGLVLKRALVSCGKYTAFHRGCSDFLRDVKKLKLYWCKAWNFGSIEKPFGPYVSENCVALCRVLKSAYSTMPMIRNQTDEREELLSKCMLMITAWIALVARLMQTEVTEELVVDVERHIKIFLSAFQDLDTTLLGTRNSNLEDDSDDSNAIAKKKKKPLIQTTANLSCLLNLPAVMREYGPLRNYWEGSYRGEGILRVVKPIITQGTHMPWFAVTALQRFYNDRSMDLLLQQEGGKNLNVYYSDTVGYATYKSMDYLDKLFLDRKPVSAVQDKNSGKLYGSVLNDSTEPSKTKWVEILLDHDESVELWSTYYCRIYTGESTKFENVVELVHILFLPNREKGESMRYYCVDENWLEMAREGQLDKFIFRLPRAHGVKY